MKLEVYFDYECPFCWEGHKALLELLPQYPQLQVEWHPCEAHPRPEQSGLHSDLCARGMYIAAELGANIEEYHQRMYPAANENQKNIEDPDVIADLIDDLVNQQRFLSALDNGCYQDQLDQNNHLTWQVYQFPAVPSLRLNGDLLPAVPGIGLTKTIIEEFLQKTIANK